MGEDSRFVDNRKWFTARNDAIGIMTLFFGSMISDRSLLSSLLCRDEWIEFNSIELLFRDFAKKKKKKKKKKRSLDLCLYYHENDYLTLQSYLQKYEPRFFSTKTQQSKKYIHNIDCCDLRRAWIVLSLDPNS